MPKVKNAHSQGLAGGRSAGGRNKDVVPPVVWTVSATVVGMLDNVADEGEKVQVIP